MAGYGSSDVWRDRLEETQCLLDLARQEIHELRRSQAAAQKLVRAVVDDLVYSPTKHLRSLVAETIGNHALLLFYTEPTVVTQEKSDGKC